MIIDVIYHPSCKPYVHTNHIDYKNATIKAPNTYNLVSNFSEYVKNNDTVLYIVGSDYRSIANHRLDKTLVESLQSKRVLLAIDLSLDGKFDTVDYIYKYVIEQENIPAEQVLFIGHSPSYKNQIDIASKKYNCGVIKYECYEYWARVQQLTFIDTLKNLGYADFNKYMSGLSKPTKKKFLCLNNTWKEHRIALLTLLHHKGLLDQSYYSFNNKPSRQGLYDRYVNTKQDIPQWLLVEQTNTLEQNWKLWIDYTNIAFADCDIQQGKDVIDKLPLILDTRDFDISIAYSPQTYLLKYYKDTYFSVVTETYCEKDEPLFLTEKIYKPISHKHPFIVLGQPNTLEFLKYKGYKTYEGMIDESYDKESDHCKRLNMVINEIERLCNLNDIELKSFKSSALVIAEHNYNLFLNEKSFITQL